MTVVLFEQMAHGLGLPLPAYETAGAAGMDIRAAVDRPWMLAPGSRVLVPTGLRIALQHGMEAQIRSRSGLALKHGVTVLNAPGTVDSDYRGEVGVILINHSADPFTICRGDRIAQMVVARVERAELMHVAELDATARGDGGFGSTGV